MNNLGKVIFIYLVTHVPLFIYQENSKPEVFKIKPEVFKIECGRWEKRGENGECLPYYQPGDDPVVKFDF